VLKNCTHRAYPAETASGIAYTFVFDGIYIGLISRSYVLHYFFALTFVTDAALPFAAGAGTGALTGAGAGTGALTAAGAGSLPDADVVTGITIGLP
jgi:hypothetical protein